MLLFVNLEVYSVEQLVAKNYMDLLSICKPNTFFLIYTFYDDLGSNIVYDYCVCE
jgi:hypothetical protein